MIQESSDLWLSEDDGNEMLNPRELVSIGIIKEERDATPSLSAQASGRDRVRSNWSSGVPTRSAMVTPSKELCHAQPDIIWSDEGLS
eukprot:755912-Amphidinium_carterae.1